MLCQDASDISAAAAAAVQRVLFATGGRRERRKQTIHGKHERPKGKLNKNEETHQYRRMGCLEIITGRVEETTINWIFDF